MNVELLMSQYKQNSVKMCNSECDVYHVTLISLIWKV